MEYTLKEVKQVILRITDIIAALKEELTEIDSRLGDGDMGISMEKGARALRTAVEVMNERDTDWESFFLSCAAALNRAAPSTMGTLLSSSLIQIGKMPEGKGSVQEKDMIRIPQIMAEAIAARGKAQVGDKTILDALVPFADALSIAYMKNKNLKNALEISAEKCREGMESTKGMTARTGRAKWLGDRNKEYPDGGAYMCYRVVKELAEGL